MIGDSEDWVTMIRVHYGPSRRTSLRPGRYRHGRVFGAPSNDSGHPEKRRASRCLRLDLRAYSLKVVFRVFLPHGTGDWGKEIFKAHPISLRLPEPSVLYLP